MEIDNARRAEEALKIDSEFNSRIQAEKTARMKVHLKEEIRNSGEFEAKPLNL